MSDLATLGIKIEMTGADQAKRSLDSVTQSATQYTKAQQEIIAKADKVAAAANDVDVQNKKLVNSYIAQVAQVRALGQQLGVLNEVQQRTAQSARDVVQHQTALLAQTRALNAEIGLSAAAQTKAGLAAGAHGLQLGRLRMELGTLIGRLTGTNTALDRMAGALASSAIGNGVVIAALAGLAAIGYAWSKITEEARAAEKAQSEAMQTLRDEIAKSKTSMESLQVKGAQEEVARARRELAALQESHTVVGPTGQVIVQAPSQGGPAQRRLIDEKTEQLSVALANQQKVLAESGRNQNAEFDRQLGTLIKHNAATDAERKIALDRLKKYEDDAAKLRKSGADNQRRVFDLEQAAALRSDLFPKDKSSGREAAQERSLSNIAAQEERRVAAAKALYAAALQGKDVYDREVHTQSLLNSLLETEQRIRADFLDKNGKQKAGTEALMAAEIARARAAVQSQDELARKTAETLEAQKQAAEEAKRQAAEAKREQERQDRERLRVATGVIDTAITDVLNKQNPIPGFVANIKGALIKAFSEALAQKFLASKFAEMLGIGVESAAKTQNVAADKMVVAAVNMLNAANTMMGLPGVGAPPSASTNTPAATSTLKKIGEYAAVAIGSYQAGQATGSALYSSSHGTFGNYARGAIGGAISGAATGAAIGTAILPGIGTAAGAVIGSVAGFIGGILGVGSASKEAAKQTAELRKALAVTMDSLRAEVGKDALAANIAQVNANRETLRKQIEDAYAGGGANSDTVKERNRQLAEMNRLEDERIQQLKQEAAVLVQRQQEDYKVRELRARGQTKQADDLAFQEQQQRERQDLITSFGDSIDAQEAATLAALDAAQAAERQAYATGQNTSALNALTSTLHNAPTGFKIAPYTYDFATPKPRTYTQNGFPQTPNSQPQLTLAPVFNIDGTKSSRDQVKSIAVELRKIVSDAFGKDADISRGWGLLA